ncbi:restriction endonuclease [Aliarcobacter cryaerophilus]|uniref:Restriction endonuclease n=1 Tax=Aliarcobacter cryaerophilus TaxID=28198 RepID=A0A2S9SU77_9BACT|nr:restriction endonuclease subunit S [Aliarcobacter cryaerophilus]PRM90122.1 restriction endonuclease [Aliarcobacter cryaerophilus]
MKYKKYPSYKNSGVEWLGDIPEHWNQRKIKHFAQTIPGGTPSTTEPEYWDGDIPWLPSGAVQNCIINEDRVIKFITKKGLYSSATKYIKPNSTLIALTGATCSNIGYLTFKSTANQSVVGIVTQKSTSDKYVFYSLISQKSQILVKRTGGAQAGINEQDVKDIFISYPPIHEQEQIANFLDKATAKIDTLTEKQTKQIELLKEKRQAVISHAVTKGINPNIPMKDSGVEWLGVIPEHWKNSKLRHYLIGIKDGTHGTHPSVDNGKLLLSGKNIKNNQLEIKDNERQISLEEHKKITANGYPKKGDLLISVVGTIGQSCVYEYDYPSSFQRSVCFLRSNKGLDVKFLQYFFQSRIAQFQLVQQTNQSTIGGVYMGDIVELIISIPDSIIEQQQIINYLDEKTSKIDTLIEKSNKSIELLKEKRTALISACVTGKIDVRKEV